MTALWISPIIKNVDSDADIDGYHGYSARTTQLNPHMGDMGALRSMVDAAHGRGMKVILDIVTNHVGQAFFYDINGNGKPDESVWGGGDLISGNTTPLQHWTEYDPEYEVPIVQDFDGRDDLLGSFTFNNEVDSVFYFSQMYQLSSVFKSVTPSEERPSSTSSTTMTSRPRRR